MGQHASALERRQQVDGSTITVAPVLYCGSLDDHHLPSSQQQHADQDQGQLYDQHQQDQQSEEDVKTTRRRRRRLTIVNGYGKEVPLKELIDQQMKRRRHVAIRAELHMTSTQIIIKNEAHRTPIDFVPLQKSTSLHIFGVKSLLYYGGSAERPVTQSHLLLFSSRDVADAVASFVINATRANAAALATSTSTLLESPSSLSDVSSSIELTYPSMARKASHIPTFTGDLVDDRELDIVLSPTPHLDKDSFTSTLHYPEEQEMLDYQRRKDSRPTEIDMSAVIHDQSSPEEGEEEMASSTTPTLQLQSQLQMPNDAQESTPSSSLVSPVTTVHQSSPDLHLSTHRSSQRSRKSMLQEISKDLAQYHQEDPLQRAQMEYEQEHTRPPLPNAEVGGAMIATFEAVVVAYGYVDAFPSPHTVSACHTQLFELGARNNNHRSLTASQINRERSSASSRDGLALCRARLQQSDVHITDAAALITVYTQGLRIICPLKTCVDMSIPLHQIKYWSVAPENKKDVVVLISVDEPARWSRHNPDLPQTDLHQVAMTTHVAVVIRFTKKAWLLCNALSRAQYAGHLGVHPATAAVGATQFPAIFCNAVRSCRLQDEAIYPTAVAAMRLCTSMVPCKVSVLSDAVVISTSAQASTANAPGLAFYRLNTQQIKFCSILSDRSNLKSLRRFYPNTWQQPLLILTYQLSEKSNDYLLLVLQSEKIEQVLQSVQQVVFDRTFREQDQQPNNVFAAIPNSEAGTVSIATSQHLLSRERLTPVSVIGQGHFGLVHLAKLEDENGAIECAVKLLKKSAPLNDKEDFLRELEVTRLLSHEHIVQFIGADVRLQPWLIVIEYVPHGDLRKVLRTLNESSVKLSDLEMVKFALQVALAMEYMSSHRYIHMDLALRNCLLGSNNHVKICDFGLTQQLADDLDSFQIEKWNGKLPIKWLPPESLFNGLFSIQSDIWGYGIVIWEMYSYGATPYGKLKGMEFQKSVRAGMRPSKPYDCPDSIYELCHKCWHKQRVKRPSFTGIRKSLGFFAETIRDMPQAYRDVGAVYTIVCADKDNASLQSHDWSSCQLDISSDPHVGIKKNVSFSTMAYAEIQAAKAMSAAPTSPSCQSKAAVSQLSNQMTGPVGNQEIVSEQARKQSSVSHSIPLQDEEVQNQANLAESALSSPETHHQKLRPLRVPQSRRIVVSPSRDDDEDDDGKEDDDDEDDDTHGKQPSGPPRATRSISFDITHAAESFSPERLQTPQQNKQQDHDESLC
eukprot:m.170691 g.170691  ORF g.170691 m.170691 type:complete len:1252 (-) comp16487_c6_seq5:228-3983(-)